MHFDHGEVPKEYLSYTNGKLLFLLFGVFLLVAAMIMAISLGTAKLPLSSVVQALTGNTDSVRISSIVWNIRLPQALASMVAGAGLAVAGAVMQAILRNPLGSPYTLGISHAAAFGAAFSVMILGTGVMTSSSGGAVNVTNPYITTFSAFLFSMVAAGIIIGIAGLRGTSPEVMVLSGVALGSLFTAGTMLLQYFADDMQLAAMVFWTFGDTARVSWQELGISAVMLCFCFLYFFANSWNYNAIEAGDETAKGLGVRVNRVRLVSMTCASLLTAVLISFMGVIGFIGLVVPHMVRRLIGSDYRFLLPATMVCGGVLLLVADTAAKLILAPHVLPVSVLTALLGAPMFFWLILRRSGR